MIICCRSLSRGSGAGSRHLFSFLLSASQLSLPSPLLLHSRPRGCPMGRWQAAAAAATTTSTTATAGGELATLATALEALEDRFTALHRYGGGQRSALLSLSLTAPTPGGPPQRTAHVEPGDLRLLQDVIAPSGFGSQGARRHSCSTLRAREGGPLGGTGFPSYSVTVAEKRSAPRTSEQAC